MKRFYSEFLTDDCELPDASYLSLSTDNSNIFLPMSFMCEEATLSWGKLQYHGTAGDSNPPAVSCTGKSKIQPLSRGRDPELRLCMNLSPNIDHNSDTMITNML